MNSFDVQFKHRQNINILNQIKTQLYIFVLTLNLMFCHHCNIIPETWYSWTSDLIIEEISTISNTLGAQCISVETVQQSSVIIA